MKEETMGIKPTVKSNGQWAATNAANAASDLQSQVIDKAAEVYNSVAKTANELVASSNKKTVSFVRQYPLQVTAGALAIGFLLGAAIRRGRA